MATLARLNKYIEDANQFRFPELSSVIRWYISRTLLAVLRLELWSFWSTFGALIDKRLYYITDWGRWLAASTGTSISPERSFAFARVRIGR
jgi:hypothetical protein